MRIDRPRILCSETRMPLFPLGAGGLKHCIFDTGILEPFGATADPMRLTPLRIGSRSTTRCCSWSMMVADGFHLTFVRLKFTGTFYSLVLQSIRGGSFSRLFFRLFQRECERLGINDHDGVADVDFGQAIRVEHMGGEIIAQRPFDCDGLVRATQRSSMVVTIFKRRPTPAAGADSSGARPAASVMTSGCCASSAVGGRNSATAATR